MKNEYADVALDEIELSTTNTMFRDPADFTPAALQDLIDSIKKSGVLSPVLLRKGKKKKYELVCGERRYRASLEAKLTLIPASIRDLGDDEALEAQVVENLQRENINPMKEAVAFKWMTKAKKLSAAAIAVRIGKSADYVQERIKLTTLSKDAQELIRTGVLPLKAGLKISRLPEQLQKTALTHCVENVEGVAGKKPVFAGFDRLQDYLDDEVVLNLAFADFDTTDPKLLPTAGSCISCPKRTKNAGTLFDSILKNDSCLDRGCFRAKQMAQYRRVEASVKDDFPTANIIRMSRADQWHLDEQLKQKLSPIIYSIPSGAVEINAAAAAKIVSEKKKLQIAVLIGTHREGKDSKKQFIFLKEVPKSTVVSSGKASSPRIPKKTEAQIQKEKDERLKWDKQNFEEVRFKAEAVLNKAWLKAIPEELIRACVCQAIDDDMNTGTVISVFNYLEVEYKLTRHNPKSVIIVKPGIKLPDDWSQIAEEYFILSADVEAVVSKLKGESLNALFAWCMHESYSMSNMNRADILKFFKINPKTLAISAKNLTDLWYKSQQKEKAAALDDFKKSEGRAPGAQIKKGLKSLIKK